MSIRLIKWLSLFVMGSLLISCSVFKSSPRQSRSDLGDQPSSMTGKPTNQSTAIGGSFESSMDVLDKSRVSRALDSGLGKPTKWVNAASGVTYTVVPTRKVKVGGNEFCRDYTITADHGGSSSQYEGTACLGDDSNWHPT